MTDLKTEKDQDRGKGGLSRTSPSKRAIRPWEGSSDTGIRIRCSSPRIATFPSQARVPSIPARNRSVGRTLLSATFDSEVG